MALSYYQTTGNGSQTNFTFSFDYLAASHIKVSVDGVDTSYVLNSTYVVEVSPAPSNGSIVKVYRETPNTSRLVDFEGGSVLLDSDLDTSALQVFFLSQETVDAVADNLTLVTTYYDANSKLIKNVADPVDDQDAATKAYGETNWGGAAADTATAQAAAAAVSAAAAAVSETNAGNSATAAATSESNAADYAAAAAVSMNSGLYKNSVDKTANYTVALTDDGYILQVDTSGGNVTITLPDSTVVAQDMRVAVAKMTGDANTVTVVRSGTDTMNGQTSMTQTVQYETYTFSLDASAGEWLVTGGVASGISAGVGITVTGGLISLDTTSSYNWTAPQRNPFTTDNDGSFALSAGHNFKCTPAAPITFQFTSLADGQGGTIRLDNSGGHAITKGAMCEADADFETNLSTAGVYLVGYITDGTTVSLSYSQGLS